MALVDELVVKLGLDNKDFQKNSKAATNQLNSVKAAGASAARGIEDSSRRMGVSMIKLASIIAAGTAAFKLFTSYVAEGANLSRLARNLGTSADSLHRWGKAVQQAGGTAQGFQSTMRSISAALTEQQTTGTSGIAGWLSVLGVSLVDAEGKAKKVETLLLDIGEGVQRKTANRADQFNILQSMGIDEGTANLILKSRVEAEKLIAQQSGFSNDAAKKAESTEAKWLAIQERINGKFRELAEKLLPTIERLVDSLSKSFETMAPMISGIADAFVKINDATDGWLTTLLLAVGALKLAKSLLPGMPGKSGAPSPASAGGGLSLLGKIGLGAGLFFGDTLSPVTQQDQTEYDLKSRAAIGDRDAAQKLARMQLDNQLWRKILGRPATEADVNQRATELLGGSARSMSGKVSGGGDMQSKLSAAEAANYDLKSRAAIGDRDAAQKLARMQLDNQLWRKILGRPATEADVSQRAAELLGSSGRSMSGSVSGGATSATRQTRAERNNNPGNLNFAGQAGASLESGSGARFAKFDTTEQGISALVKQLQIYQRRGIDSISKIMAIYAPPSENDTQGYIKSMSQWTGLDANASLNFNDPETLRKMVHGISRKEGRFTPLTDAQVMTGISMAGVGRGSQGANQVSIGEINIQTAATDARGIASAIRQELVMQANTGMR